jgi:hypothetical protein
MRRRDFLKGIAGSATGWPLVARAQQPMPVIGFLDRGSPVAMAANLAAFQKGLADNGYNEDKNVRIEYRWAEGKNDRLPALAAELVRLPVAVIAATRTSAPAMAAKAATSTNSDSFRNRQRSSQRRLSPQFESTERQRHGRVPSKCGADPKTAQCNFGAVT